MTAPALVRCDSCHAPAADLPTSYGAGTPEVLCPQCAARVALEEAAARHLHTLIYPVVLAWARHWSAAGVSAGGLGTALDLEGVYWHPDGAYERPSAGFESAVAVIREALA